MAISRRSFLRSCGEIMAGAAVSGVLRPSCVFAQGGPGRIKNYIDVFLYGGADARFVFPYVSGPLRDAVNARRSSIQITDVRQLSNMDQQGRGSPVGFHFEWQDLLTELDRIGAGATIVTEYGITSNTNTSHEIATQHFFNASSLSPSTIAQGWLARAIDAYELQSMAVWGVNVSQPVFFNATSTSPMVLTALSGYNFSDRNFGAFDCSGVQGTLCSSSSDRNASAAEDSAYARAIARQINALPSENMPLGEAIRGTVDGIFESVPVVQAMAGISLDALRFRPSAEQTFSTTFANNMMDVARIVNYTNSESAPESLRNSSKLIACGIGGWDSHASILSIHPFLIRRLAGALKGLISYLSDWGLLESTVITLKSEFGRTTQVNAALGTDHAQGAHFMMIGGGSLVPRRVIGPEAHLQEAQSLNYFTPQVPVTGLLRRILPEIGFTSDKIGQVLPYTMPGEDLVPELFL